MPTEKTHQLFMLIRKMKIPYRTLVLCLLFVSILTGCYYDNEDELYPNKSGCDTSNVTYSGIIKPLVDSRCAVPGCHVSGAQPPNLSTYTGLVTNIDRVKVRALELKTMPAAGPLSQCEIDQMWIWINAGSPNN